MASRPVFFAAPDRPGFVECREVDFTWYAGFSVAQKQRSIRSLHESAGADGPLLEISSKSTEALGVALSAFHLMVETVDGEVPLECAFQGSKVFAGGGPFRDLFEASPRDAKRDDRLRSSGPLVGFDFGGDSFPLEPKTFFYDWLYATAVARVPEYRAELPGYVGFTDIEFNPKRSLNCQAQSAARYAGLSAAGKLAAALEGPEQFRRVVWGEPGPVQTELFDSPR
jgi:type I restriction enzyme M protein